MENLIEDPKNLDQKDLQSESQKEDTKAKNEPGTRSLYSTDDQTNDMVDLESLGFNTTIKQKKSDLLDPSQLNDTVISSVMQSSDRVESSEPVLEKLDSFEDDLNLTLVIEREKERKAQIIKYTFFGLLAFALILGAVFFTDATQMLGYTSLKETSKQTTSQALETSKVDLAFSNLYQASLSSQQLSFRSVELRNQILTKNNKFTTPSELQDAEQSIKKITTNIVQDLDFIKDRLNDSSEILQDNTIKVALLTKLATTEYQGLILASQKSDSNKSEFLSTDQIVSEIRNLVSNPEIKAVITNSDYASFSDQELLNFLVELLSKYQNSYLKQLALLSIQRSSFISVLAELDQVTKSFDPDFVLFDTREDFIIRHNSYSFDVNNSSVSVSTEVKTETPDTFSLVADLEDAIKESPMFSGLNVTSFQKQEAQSGDSFQSSLNLNFEFSQL